MPKKTTVTIEPIPRDIPVLGLRMQEAADALGISLSLLQDLIRDGTIQPVRFGRAVVIYVDELRRVLEEGTEIGRTGRIDETKIKPAA